MYRLVHALDKLKKPPVGSTHNFGRQPNFPKKIVKEKKPPRVTPGARWCSGPH
jgi:hypothetical protein